MGCDIHIHIEVKLAGKWQHYSCPSMSRNYRLFAKMADVRNEPDRRIVPISKPKGLPEDVTDLTIFSCKGWGVDAHSHSYLTAIEIAELSDWAMVDAKQFGGTWDLEDSLHCYLFGNSFDGFTKYPGDNPVGLEDVRFVFWFDN